MRDEESPTAHLIRGIAVNQHGVVSRAQLLEAGIPGRAIDGRIRSGWLLPACRGVYALGRPVSSRQGLWSAAVLAGGKDAVLAGRSAASHWNFLKWDGQIDLLRSRSRDPRQLYLRGPGLNGTRIVEVRRTETFDPDVDAIFHRGILTASVARTLLDLAGMLDEARFRSAFNEADRNGLLRDEDLRICVGRGRNCKGISRFRSVVEQRNPTVRLTRSELEVFFLTLCRDHRIPDPLVNRKVIGLEVDCLWPDHGLIVELDGFEFHRGRMASIEDGNRDIRLRAAGFRVLRFTYDAVVNRPDEVMRVVAMELAISFPDSSSPK